MGPVSLLVSGGVLLLAICFGIGVIRDAGGSSEAPLGSGKMFDTIAGRYDIINTVLSLGMHVGWRERMIEVLELKPGDKVLDAGTGTADVAIMVAKHLSKINEGRKLAEDSVIGVDPSENMLSIGRQKVSEAGFGTDVVRLQLGDAQDLSTTLPENQRFNAITMAFAIRNVPDRARALSELAARLYPGGRLAILELGAPSFLPARWFVRYCVPIIGSLMSGGAWREYLHLERSVLAFDSKEFTALMEKAGLQVRPVEWMNFGSVGLYLAEKPAQG